MRCPLRNVYSSGWILSILGTNDHYHERVCRAPWPLTLTYISKVIPAWLCNKTVKICPSRPCPLRNVYSSGWILSMLGTNDHYHERVCRAPWPLNLTYIFKVISTWLCNKTAKMCPSRMRCPLCNVYNSGWILSMLCANDHYHERMCRAPWPLTLTYISKVIPAWLCNKTAKICPSRPCPLRNVYSSGWILSILGTNDHYHKRVCCAPWPLTLTYIFKVIPAWLCNKNAKICPSWPCPLRNVYTSIWILFILGTNDHYHEGGCRASWPLTLTFIFKVIRAWLCNKTAKICPSRQCPLHNVYTSGWILFILGSNDLYLSILGSNDHYLERVCRMPWPLTLNFFFKVV